MKYIITGKTGSRAEEVASFLQEEIQFPIERASPKEKEKLEFEALPALAALKAKEKNPNTTRIIYIDIPFPVHFEKILKGDAKNEIKRKQFVDEIIDYMPFYKEHKADSIIDFDETMYCSFNNLIKNIIKSTKDEKINSQVRKYLHSKNIVEEVKMTADGDLNNGRK